MPSGYFVGPKTSPKSISQYLQEDDPVFSNIISDGNTFDSMFYVKKNGQQSFTTGTIIPVTFGTKNIDIGNEFNLSTSSFIPNENGYYLFNMHLRMNLPSAPSDKWVALRHGVNRIFIDMHEEEYPLTSLSGLSPVIYLEAGTVVFVEFYTSTATTSYNNNDQQWFCGYRIR
jgi:hypothetical protein